jgi:transglutaminase-like putative cysteine protease
VDFEITHLTHYKYSHPAAEAYGEARLTPPTQPGQTVLSHRLTLEPEVKTSSYTDHFGNQVEFFSLPFRHRQLTLRNALAVRTAPVLRPQESLDLPFQDARQILNSALPDIFDYLEPTEVIEPGRDAASWARKYFPPSAPLGEALERLNEAIHREFRYQPGTTENTTPLAAVWKAKAGVCQDFAHIGLSVLRTAGLPSRYVCGYIETDAQARGEQLTGAVATHAWVEVLVPGMKWVALDPTNRQWVDERYVAVSYGRDYRDAAPLRGTFKGSGGQKMSVQVHMRRRREKGRG